MLCVMAIPTYTSRVPAGIIAGAVGIILILSCVWAWQHDRQERDAATARGAHGAAVGVNYLVSLAPTFAQPNAQLA